MILILDRHVANLLPFHQARHEVEGQAVEPPSYYEGELDFPLFAEEEDSPAETREET